MKLGDLLQALLEDWVRYRWRDTVALWLIAGGFAVMLWTTDTGIRGEAKTLIGAGLIILNPRGMLPGTSGNGSGQPSTSSNPTAPATALPPVSVPTPAAAAGEDSTATVTVQTSTKPADAGPAAALPSPDRWGSNLTMNKTKE
jgi:hypothetical protein